MSSRTDGTADTPRIAEDADRSRDRRTVQRRRLLVIAAAVAVGVVAAGPWLYRLGDNSVRPVPAVQLPSASPTSGHAARTPDDLPVGRAPRVPYVEAGQLHVKGDVIPTTGNELAASGGTVLVGRGSATRARWWLLTRGALTQVHVLDGVFAPRLSPNGDLLVWTTYPDSRTTRVTAWSPTTRTELDHVDLAAPYAECCGGGQQVELWGIDGQDAVYWSDGRDDRVWRPGKGAPRRLTGAADVSQIAPAGPVLQGGAVGRVDANGHWTQQGELPSDQSTLWSSDGSALVYAGDDTGAVGFKQSPTDQWALDTATGRRVRLDLPAGVRAGALAFEDDGSVLLDAFTNPGAHYVVRCRTTDGACEQALPPAPVGKRFFVTGPG